MRYCFRLNAKTALRNYLQQKGFSTTEKGTTLSGTHGANTITATFDANERLENLNGQLKN